MLKSRLLNKKLFTAIRNNLPFIFTFSIISLLFLLSKILQSNESQVLANAKHFFDPQWIPNDWFLNQDIGYRSSFNWILGPPSKIVPLYVISIAGRFVSYLLFSMIIQKLVRLLKINILLVIPFIFIFATHQSMVAKEWMLGGLETKVFAYICVLGSIIAFLERRYWLMFIVTGLAASFHVLVGLYATFCLGISLLIHFKSIKHDIVKIICSSLFFFIAAAPALMAVFQYLSGTKGVDTIFAGYLFSVFRNPHHLFPGFWTKNWTVQFTISLILFLVVFIRSKDRRLRFLAIYGLSSMVLFCIGMGLYYSGKYHLLKYYWFRFPDTMVPFLAFLLITCYASGLLRTKKANAAETRIDHPPLLYPRKAIAAALVLFSLYAGVYSAWRFYSSLSKIIKSDTPFYLSHLDKGLKDALLWIRDTTPADATILASPFIDEFYIAAGRAQFVSFKHCPQSDKEMIDWYHRLIFLNNNKRPQPIGFKMRKEIEESFYSMNMNRIKILADKYKLNYYLGRSNQSLPFRIMYINKLYTIYKLP